MITVLLFAALLYLAAGFLFALVFAFRWVDNFDQEARGAHLGFRLLILPGCTLLWPYLMKRHLQKRKV